MSSRLTTRAPVAAIVMALLAVVAIPTIVSAHAPTPVRSFPGATITTYSGSSAARYAPIVARADSVGPVGRARAVAQTSTIEVTYHGFSIQAKAAFQAAANVWQGAIVSPRVIHVDAYWSHLGSSTGILGQAGPTRLYLDSDNYVYPAALEEARCDCNANSGAEISAQFNADFTQWYLGTDGSVPHSKWDLETVVLHELGHGLGFLSSFEVTNGGKGYWGYTSESSGTSYPLRYDADEWSAKIGGSLMTSFANGSTALRSHLTNGSVYLGGTNLEAILGERAQLYAPSPWEPGSSNSHLDEARFAPGTVSALMTPILNNGEAIHDPGAVTLAIFRDIGWHTAGANGVDTTPPTVGVPAVRLGAPQAFSSSSFRVAVSWPAAVDDSGISAYELQRQKGSGAWANISLNSPTTTSATVAVATGKTYRFRVRATDGASNVGPWTTGAAGKVNLFEEDAAGVSYSSGWARKSLSGSTGGKVKKSTTAGATATLSFVGTGAGFVTTLGSNRGKAKVWLDSILVTTLDLYQAGTATGVVRWSSAVLASGAHTLAIVVKGTANPSSSGTRVDVDAFVAWP